MIAKYLLIFLIVSCTGTVMQQGDGVRPMMEDYLEAIKRKDYTSAYDHLSRDTMAKPYVNETTFRIGAGAVLWFRGKNTEYEIKDINVNGDRAVCYVEIRRQHLLSRAKKGVDVFMEHGGDDRAETRVIRTKRYDLIKEDGTWKIEM